MNWKDALKEFNEKRKQNKEGAYIIPKRGTPEYMRVRKLMDNDEDLPEWDATEVKAKRSESKSRTPPKKELAVEPILEKKVVSEQNTKFKKTKVKKVPEPEPMSPEPLPKPTPKLSPRQGVGNRRKRRHLVIMVRTSRSTSKFKLFRLMIEIHTNLNNDFYVSSRLTKFKNTLPNP